MKLTKFIAPKIQKTVVLEVVDCSKLVRHKIRMTENVTSLLIAKLDFTIFAK